MRRARSPDHTRRPALGKAPHLGTIQRPTSARACHRACPGGRRGLTPNPTTLNPEKHTKCAPRPVLVVELAQGVGAEGDGEAQQGDHEGGLGLAKAHLIGGRGGVAAPSACGDVMCTSRRDGQTRRGPRASDTPQASCRRSPQKETVEARTSIVRASSMGALMWPRPYSPITPRPPARLHTKSEGRTSMARASSMDSLMWPRPYRPMTARVL